MRRALLALAALLLTALSASAEEKGKIAVLDLDAKSNLPEGMVKLLNEVILTELEKAVDLSVLSSSDITSIMTLEEQRVQFTGCGDDGCLAEVGGALGANLLLTSSLGVMGSKYIFNIKIVDTNTADSVKRVSVIVEKDDDKLLAAIKRTVHQVVAPLRSEEQVPGDSSAGSADSLPGTTGAEEATDAPGANTVTGSTEEAETQAGPLDYLPWVSLCIAGAAAIAGGTMIGLGVSDYKAMDDELKGSRNWEDLGDSSDRKLIAGQVVTGVALAAGVGAVVLFLVGGDDETEVRASLEPAARGFAATASIRF